MATKKLTPQEEIEEYERLYNNFDEDARDLIAEKEANGYRPTLEQFNISGIPHSAIVFYTIH